MPPWLWGALAGLGILAVVLALTLLPRARRRRTWDADLATARLETRWLAFELIPQLQLATTTDEFTGGWRTAASRVMLLEDQLTGLESGAPDDSRAHHARVLRDAVRLARRTLEGLVGSGEPGGLPRELASIATRLSTTLEPSAGAG